MGLYVLLSLTNVLASSWYDSKIRHLAYYAQTACNTNPIFRGRNRLIPCYSIRFPTSKCSIFEHYISTLR